jgi:hypothetical protein
MTADEIRRSVEAREYARHSNAMEGLYETPEESALLDAVARGKSTARNIAVACSPGSNKRSAHVTRQRNRTRRS